MHNIRPSVTIIFLLHDTIEKQFHMAINIKTIYIFLPSSSILTTVLSVIDNEKMNYANQFNGSKFHI